MANKETILKYLNGELSDQELDQFKQSEEFQFISTLDNELERFKAPEMERKDFSFEKVETKAGIQRYLRPILQIAAIIFIISSIVFYIIPDNSKINTTIAEQKSFLLPDKSQVVLNAGSSIEWNKSWDTERKLTLTGEAFFKVEKGQKFTVNTDLGKVEVLGTQFNVVSRDKFFQVICYEGKVAVSFDGQSSFLEKGEAWQFDGTTFSTWNSNKATPTWIDGNSEFKSTPYKIVVSELKRQFKINVKCENIDENKLFTGSFNHDNLEEALKSITIPFDITYSIEEEYILLSKNTP